MAGVKFTPGGESNPLEWTLSITGPVRGGAAAAWRRLGSRTREGA